MRRSPHPRLTRRGAAPEEEVRCHRSPRFTALLDRTEEGESDVRKHQALSYAQRLGGRAREACRRGFARGDLRPAWIRRHTNLSTAADGEFVTVSVFDFATGATGSRELAQRWAAGQPSRPRIRAHGGAARRNRCQSRERGHARGRARRRCSEVRERSSILAARRVCGSAHAQVDESFADRIEALAGLRPITRWNAGAVRS